MALFSDNHANSLNHKWHSIRRRSSYFGSHLSGKQLQKQTETGIVAKDVKIIPEANIAELTSVVNFHVSMDAVSPNFRLFFASGNAPGSLASLLKRTELSD